MSVLAELNDLCWALSLADELRDSRKLRALKTKLFRRCAVLLLEERRECSDRMAEA